jgi:hypothetical protein
MQCGWIFSIGRTKVKKEMGYKKFTLFATIIDNLPPAVVLHYTPIPVAIMVTRSKGAYHCILKIARTIAEMSGWDKIHPAHLAQSLQYRPLMMDG